MTSVILRKAIERQHKEAERKKRLEEIGEEEIPHLYLLKKNIEGAVQICREKRQDWSFEIVGAEGSGKSTMAAHVARILAELTNQKLDLNESMIYSFDERDRHGKPLVNSMLGFVDKYQTTPFKILWYDEAVSVLFSDDHATKESKSAKKLFVVKRDMCHFDIVVAPSPFHIVKDIRERRIKTMIYCYIAKDENTGRFKHKYAWYSAEKIVEMSLNQKARAVFRRADKFKAIVPPDFEEDFQEMDKKFEEEYLINKRSFQRTFIDTLIGDEKTAADLVLPDGFSFSSAFDKLTGRTDTESVGES